MVNFLITPSDEVLFLEPSKTKNDLIQDVLKVAASLNVQNVEIFLESSYEFCVSLFACFMVGIKPHLINSGIKSECNFLIDNKKFKELLVSDVKPLGAKKLPEDSSLFLRTSGSSGVPKSIEKSMDFLAREALYFKDFFGVKPYHRFFSSVSHQHLFGLSFKIFLPLVSGAKIISKLTEYPEVILVQELKGAFLVSSPAVLKRVVKYPNFHLLGDLHKIITAGSALPQAVMEKFDINIGKKITEIYGSTESGAIAYRVDESEYIPFEPVSCVINECLEIESPWCRPFVTSDVVEPIKNGFRLIGRSDRVIKLEDKRIDLGSIEAHLLTHDFLKECFISLHPKHDRFLALIVLSDEGISAFRKKGKSGVVAKLREHLKLKFQQVFMVRYFKILEELPINAQGKITKDAIANSLKPKKNIEWKSISKSENEALFEGRMGLDYFCFSGHFLNFPLTPGFVELGFVYEKAQDLGLCLNNTRLIENLKFQAFLRPNDVFKLHLLHEKEKLYFKIFDDKNIFASGRICTN